MVNQLLYDIEVKIPYEIISYVHYIFCVYRYNNVAGSSLDCGTKIFIFLKNALLL